MTLQYRNAFLVSIVGIVLCAFCYQWGNSVFYRSSKCTIFSVIPDCTAAARIHASIFYNPVVYSPLYLYLSGIVLIVGLFMVVPHPALRILRLVLWIVAIVDLMANVYWAQTVPPPMPRLVEAMPMLIAILAGLIGISELAVRLSTGIPAKRLWKRTPANVPDAPLASSTD